VAEVVDPSYGQRGEVDIKMGQVGPALLTRSPTTAPMRPDRRPSRAGRQRPRGASRPQPPSHWRARTTAHDHITQPEGGLSRPPPMPVGCRQLAPLSER